MKNLMQNLKKPLLFALALLPVAIIGGIFTGMYMIDTSSPENLKMLLSQFGSTTVLIVITTIQTCTYALFCGFFGYILADKIGLIKPFKVEKDIAIKAIAFGAITGALLVIDYCISGNIYPTIKEVTKTGLSVSSIIASILYGGIIEEIMMRLFLMSFIIFVIWKLFLKKKSKEEIPTAVFVVANIIIALTFAAGHLPATILMFVELTPLLLIRCFLLNGIGGLFFGELYHKHGIQYAIIAHMGAHIISKLVFILFI
ncbi:MAG: CPBP family intramembrane glutamic endopeptidase [Acutalibacteraceae bacterium]|nr:CPBP family intramembrane glutamic endopeptidase [Acutalibacteraceae bacterium]